MFARLRMCIVVAALGSVGSFCAGWVLGQRFLGAELPVSNPVPHSAQPPEVGVTLEPMQRIQNTSARNTSAHRVYADAFPRDLLQYAAELHAKAPLGEREDRAVAPRTANSNRDHPFMATRPLQAAMRGKRVLFLGHSHLQAITNQLAASMGVAFNDIDAWFGGKKKFLIRKMFEGAPFSLYYESLVSLNYRAALRKATPEVVDAHRFDVIYVTRSMWDLVYYDTHPKDFADSFSEALVELLDVFLKKKGGKLVVWPLHSVKSDRDRRGCFPRDRALLIREATFLAIRHASEKSGVPIVGPGAASSSSQSIIIWDPFEFTKNLPVKTMPDGQHADERTTLAYAEVLIRGVFRCRTVLPMSNVTSNLMKTSFPDGISEEMHRRIDWLAATPKSQIPWGKRKCRCGRTELGVESVHPTCLSFSPKSRYLMVQRYLKYPLVGPSELQMKELIHLICTAKRARVVQDCFRNMGVTEEMSENLTLPLVQPSKPTSTLRCSCLTATTSVQGWKMPRCAGIAELELGKTVPCPYLNSNASFTV